MTYIPAELRQLVMERVAERCEYCGLSQEGQEATFHIDHVIPVAAGGQTIAENLALACVSCSLRKAARQTAIDPQSGKDVILLLRSSHNTFHSRGELIMKIEYSKSADALYVYFQEAYVDKSREIQERYVHLAEGR